MTTDCDTVPAPPDRPEEFALGDAPTPETPPELDPAAGLGSDVDPSTGGKLATD